MKKVWFFACILLIFGCEAADKDLYYDAEIAAGHYEGTITYKGNVYWEAVVFDEETFTESVSLDVNREYFVKDCNMEGKYSIYPTEIEFFDTENKSQYNICEKGLILDGLYTLDQFGDSLVFWKIHKEEVVKYNLVYKRQE